MPTKLVNVKFSQVKDGEMFIYDGDSSWIKEPMAGNQSTHNAYRTNFAVKGHRRGEVCRQFEGDDIVQVIRSVQ